MTEQYIAYFKKMDTPFLKGRTAIVTGSSRGIGREMALALAGAGANAVVCCNQSVAQGEDVCAQIAQAGGQAILFQGDLCRNSEASRLVRQAAEAFGGIDILVNNAGITDPRPFDQITEEDWDRLEQNNMKTMFNCCQYAVPWLKKSAAGRILNISSVCGKSGGIGAGANYCANKAGAIGLTKALANQLAADGVTVNGIAPAMIDTEMIRWRTPQQMEACVAGIPLRRIGTPAEVAQPAVFLCSDFAAYITGYTMDVCGGMYMD